MKSVAVLILFFTSLAHGQPQLVLNYQIFIKQANASAVQTKKETIYLLPNNRLWIEVKKDHFYVSYQTGVFYFFDLTSGTRHLITQRESTKSISQSSSQSDCKVRYMMLEKTSPNKEQYELCLTDARSTALPIEVFHWLMNPTLKIDVSLDLGNLAFTPQTISFRNTKGEEAKRILLKDEKAILFKDDTDELWKLPVGKPCSTRYCGKLI